MKDKERDIFDDLFRSKLQDFEADTMPGDWEAIADRLPVKKSSTSSLPFITFPVYSSFVSMRHTAF